jgi:hypothetical protein
MVPTADVAAVEEIATRRGAKILLTGDTEQLSAPQAGGAMRLLADEHGYYQLSTVQRFDQDWEREASLRLRSGDADVLAEYDQRGRILEGTREQISDTAYQWWLADHLSGIESVLLTTTNAQATELARRARDQLAALGLVDAGDLADLAELADGNVAGPGDLIVARQNARIVAGEDGRSLANRDVLRFDAWDEIGEERVAMVRRVADRDPRTGEVRWSVPFELPETYLERHADLAYAGNVHAAEGRTVGTSHLVVDDTAGRDSLYVGMTRGRAQNTAYVVTEAARAADLSPEPRPAPAIKDPAAEDKKVRRPDRLTVLAGVLERAQSAQSATETMRHEQDRAASLATLAPIWADVTRAHAGRRYENTIQSLLPPEQWQRYQQDPERDTLTRLLRAADLAGHDTHDVLRRAVQRRDFAGAQSIAAVLHGRVHRITGPAPDRGSPEQRASWHAVPDLLVLAGPAGLLAPLLSFAPAAAWRRPAAGGGEPPGADGAPAAAGRRACVAPLAFVLAMVVSGEVTAALALSWLMTSASPSATGVGLEGINGPVAAVIASLVALPGSILLAAASSVCHARCGAGSA